jgi:hypothetical protein
MFASLFQYLTTGGSILIVVKRNTKSVNAVSPIFCTKTSSNVSALPLQEDSSEPVAVY